MKNAYLLAGLLVFSMIIGCTGNKYETSPYGQTQIPFFGSGNRIIYPTYFELVKNSTSGDYYVYFILANKQGYNEVVPAWGNITFTNQNDEVFYSTSFNVTSEDYEMYYSRISKEPIGKAYLVPIDGDEFTPGTEYFNAVLDIYIPDDIGPKLYKETRSMLRMSNVATVK